MAQIGSDSFTGTPGVELPAYNPAWVLVSGLTSAMTISSSGDKANGMTSGATSAYYRSDIAPPGADYSVSADFYFVAQVVNGPAMGVIMRASEAANTSYELRYLSTGNGNGSWQIRRLINGTATTLSSVAGTHIAGDSKNVKISAVGATLTGIVDGAEILTASDSSIPAIGRAGLRSFGATSTRIQTDNFSVDTPQGTGQDGTANLTGVAAGPATGTVQASGSASVPLIGVAASPGVGAIAASGAATAMLVGAAAAPDVGSITASVTAGGAANAIMIGIAASPRVGAITARGGALAVVGGVSEEVPPIGAPLGGVAANPAVGYIAARSDTAPLEALLRRIPLARDFRIKTIHFSN